MKTLNLDHPTEIKDNEFADNQNMVQGPDGLWENRKGIKSFDNAVGSDAKIHSIHFWEPSPGSSRYLTVASDEAIYSYAESAAYNDGSFTSRQTGFTAGTPFSFAQYADNLIATNGAESMYSTTNNTSWTQRNGANTRVAKYILFANDIGYAADVASNRSKLYYGSAVPASPWEFANAVDIESDNGQIINAITNLGPIVFAGKDRSIYSVDVATPAREQLDYGGGIISDRSVVRADNSVYFATIDGIFSLAQRQGTTGSFAVTPLSEPIQDLWDALINKNQIAGIYFQKEKLIFWAVETAEQKYTLVYNTQFNSWSYFIGVNAADWTIYEDSDGEEHLIYGDANTDYVRELLHPDRDDDSAPINSVLTTKNFNFGTDLYKTVEYIDISGYGSELMELDVEIFFDNSSIAESQNTITSSNFVNVESSGEGALASGSLASSALAGSVASNDDLEVQYFVYRIPLEREFRNIQIRLSNSQSGVRWRFKTIRIKVNEEVQDLFETANYA